MTKSFYFPLVLTVGGNVLYQLSQKSIPRTAHPLYSMMLAYAVGILACGTAALFVPAEGTFKETLRATGWPIVVLGIGIAAVEVGYLVAYRSGWKISVAPVMTSALVTAILVPIGLIAFKERLSPLNLFGIALCVAGLALVRQ
ncbi:MAG TPA: hypothetical protein VGR00_02435 [Thermoanaerobaculia bacterium]|nr:hypothetical protein [Thermoanaerobaculia bacterium]